jgi:hypothetical protein
VQSLCLQAWLWAINPSIGRVCAAIRATATSAECPAACGPVVVGELLRLSSAGESHGPAVVAIVAGLSAGLALDRAAIDTHSPRRPGRRPEWRRATVEPDAHMGQTHSLNPKPSRRIGAQSAISKGESDRARPQDRPEQRPRCGNGSTAAYPTRTALTLRQMYRYVRASGSACGGNTGWLFSCRCGPRRRGRRSGGGRRRPRA